MTTEELTLDEARRQGLLDPPARPGKRRSTNVPVEADASHSQAREPRVAPIARPRRPGPAERAMRRGWTYTESYDALVYRLRAPGHAAGPWLSYDALWAWGATHDPEERTR